LANVKVLFEIAHAHLAMSKLQKQSQPVVVAQHLGGTYRLHGKNANQLRLQ
jgi:hypothetical protein